MSTTAPETPPELPDDGSEEERSAIDREIWEGGPIPPDRDDPVARDEDR